MPYIDKTVTVNGIPQKVKIWKSVFNGPQIDESLGRILNGDIDNAEASAQAAAEQAKGYAQSASSSALEAGKAVQTAEAAKEGAEAARESIENMTVSARNLPPGSDATADKTAVGGSFHIGFGIPAGKQGADGPEGRQGIQGPPGRDGVNGVAVPSAGQWALNVDENGHLILGYTGDQAPDLSINKDGHLILNIT